MAQLHLIQRAIQHGDRVALHRVSERDCDANTTTYSELVEHSQAVALRLLDGAKDLCEARVAYLVPSGKDYVTSQWGIWLAGGVAVPLSFAATESELEYVLRDSGVSVVMTTTEQRDKLDGLCLKHGLRLLSIASAPTSADVRLPDVKDSRGAMILYTSGTTSRPKGVVTTHACIRSQMEALVEAWHWQTDDRIPLFLPLHHIHGIINILSCGLWSGACIEPYSRFDMPTILRRVAEGAYSVFMAVPTIYVSLIDELTSLPAEQLDPIVRGFADMRLMVSGSAALPASVHENWTELTGQRLLERYGMTEIGMALSNPYHGERRPGAVGQPLPRVEIRLQSESGEIITQEGTAGEIQVRGPSVFREYWGKSDATQEAFVDGWFKTGDIAVVEDDYYRIMGRRSVDIIKSGGYKLSALEIEAVLLDHPSIIQCAVVGLPDERWGETVAAAIVIGGQQDVGLEELQSWSKERMSHYKLPRRLLTVDELPRNAMGKVTKPAVKKLFE